MTPGKEHFQFLRRMVSLNGFALRRDLQGRDYASSPVKLHCKALGWAKYGRAVESGPEGWQITGAGRAALAQAEETR